jgi:hypothetical protein
VNNVLLSEHSPQKTPASVQVDQQAGHGVEQPLAMLGLLRRDPHGQPPVLP